MEGPRPMRPPPVPPPMLSWEKVSDSTDTWLDPPISVTTCFCDFISFSLEKLLSPVITDKGRASAIRKSADMFGKRFIRVCLWRKCKISRGSFRRNYAQSSSVCVNILAMFNVCQGCSGVGKRYFALVTLREDLDYIKTWLRSHRSARDT